MKKKTLDIKSSSLNKLFNFEQVQEKLFPNVINLDQCDDEKLRPR